MPIDQHVHTCIQLKPLSEMLLQNYTTRHALLKDVQNFYRNVFMILWLASSGNVRISNWWDYRPLLPWPSSCTILVPTYIHNFTDVWQRLFPLLHFLKERADKTRGCHALQIHGIVVQRQHNLIHCPKHMPTLLCTSHVPVEHIHWNQACYMYSSLTHSQTVCLILQVVKDWRRRGRGMRQVLYSMLASSPGPTPKIKKRGLVTLAKFFICAESA